MFFYTKTKSNVIHNIATDDIYLFISVVAKSLLTAQRGSTIVQILLVSAKPIWQKQILDSEP